MTFDTKDIETAWREEVSARVSALERGDAQLIPWAQVRAKLAKKLGESPEDRHGSPGA